MSERLIPYQPMDLAEPAELVAAIRKRRGGQFINLDRSCIACQLLKAGIISLARFGIIYL